MESIGDQPYITLNTGAKIPQIGLGTYAITDEAAKKSIKDAIIEVGYRHIDTATVYENEG